MKHERGESAHDQDRLNVFEASLLAVAATGIIGSMALRGTASKKAFWTGTAALMPLAYRLKQGEEEWHRRHPELRSSASIH